jgi:hypothetical protein
MSKTRMVLQEVSLIPAADGPQGDAAFDGRKMADVGIGPHTLTLGLTKALSPFAALLRDGGGVGLIDRGDTVSVIGLRAAPLPVRAPADDEARVEAEVLEAALKWRAAERALHSRYERRLEGQLTRAATDARRAYEAAIEALAALRAMEGKP